MEHQLTLGMCHQIDREVVHEQTAAAFGSGDVFVYATPCLILQLEQSAALAVQQGLAEGCATVGTLVNIKHLAATPIGMTVHTKAVLKEIDGRRLVFDVEAWDDKEIVGSGTHERVIILKEKFMDKAKNKLRDCPEIS